MEIELDSPFLIKPVPGFAPTIGHLLVMLNYARQTTLLAVEGLGVEALDFMLDDRANSIGMLLEHAAGVEEWYQEATLGIAFEGEALERRELGGNLGERARELIGGRPLASYLQRLRTVRQLTLRELAQRDDAWLFEEGPFWDGQPANNYFKWFHVFEDELNHRGQIRFIRRRLPAALRPSNG